MNASHLFLCGVGRSGTTILRTSLGMHPDIYYNNRENNVVQDLLAVAKTNSAVASRKHAMVVEQDEYHRIFRDAISDLLWPDQDLRKRPIQMAAINPSGDQLDCLCEVFPGAHIIGLVRNGIEVVSSRMRYESFAQGKFESHCNVWNRCQGVFEWGQANPDRFRLIRHEWFYDSEQLGKKLDEVFDWLNIEVASQPAAGVLNRLQHPTGSETEILVDFAMLTEQEKAAYFQAKANRWQDWNEEQRDRFKADCGNLMNILGYQMPW